MDRTSYLGGSDAADLMKGNWLDVYNRKMGIVEPEDLSGVFPVQLGAFTESFHLDWIETDLGSIDRRNEMFRHNDMPFIAGHIDGWSLTHNMHVETKHTGGYESMEVLIERYAPQNMHYCNVMGRNECYFSVIMGNREPEPIKLTFPQEWLDELFDMEVRFWNNHIKAGVEPDFMDMDYTEKKISDGILIDDMREVDMSTNNQWAFEAADYFECEGPAAKFTEAKNKLKALVEKDVSKASGHGLVIKRDKRGALRFSKEKANE